MRTGWLKRERKKESVSLFRTHPATSVADYRKVARAVDDIERGLGNYLLFQRFQHHYWPLWLSASLDEFERHFQPVNRLCLNNSYCRDCLNFTNILSSAHLQIDPSGMISPSSGTWSIESWIISGGNLYRPQRHVDNVEQFRDERSTLITTNWSANQVNLTTTIYGTRTSIDEAIIDLQCLAQSGSVTGKSLVIAIRPYNIDTIGGLNHLEYRDGNKTVRINKKDTVHFSKNPRNVYAGSGLLGDISFREHQEKISCEYGMASMALVFPIKKNGIDLKLRLSLTEGKPVDALKLNYPVIKKDFTDYSELMKNKGFCISMLDDKYLPWLYSTKLTALGNVNSAISALKSDEAGIEPWKTSYYLVTALNRMGYESESKLVIESWDRTITIPEKPGFTEIIRCCYYISAFSDYFTLVRDTEFLQSHYDKIRSIAELLLKHEGVVTQQKKPKSGENSLSVLSTATGHIHDLMLYAYAMGQYSYLCRTIGLFGDEIRYNKECQKLHAAITQKIIDTVAPSSNRENSVQESGFSHFASGDEFIAYTCFSNYPFNVEGVKSKDYQRLVDLITSVYGKFPLFIKSMGGWDMFLTVMISNNLLMVKDPRSHELFDVLRNLGGRKYALADWINPVTLRGIYGNGESTLVNSGLFLLMRNMILIDTQNRLELFPLPKPEWFKPGFEMTVENAPTRFGKINFKMLSTQNEVQLFFNELPKFIPPDIMINLPWKTVLKDGDDFVLKKEDGNSYIINGWPSVIRFGRQ